MLCSDCTPEISEPTVVMASAKLQVSHFNQAVKLSMSNLGFKNIKEISSLQSKSHTWFPKRTCYVCFSSKGLREIFNLPTSSTSSCGVVFCLQGSHLTIMSLLFLGNDSTCMIGINTSGASRGLFAFSLSQTSASGNFPHPHTINCLFWWANQDQIVIS